MATTTYSPRLQKKYKDEGSSCVDEEVRLHDLSCSVRASRKICLNQGVKGSVSDKKLIDDADQRK